MKNTLLALMLVSSLFVISCGADATKPGDAYKNQPTETTTGTKTANNITVSADATSGVYNTINIENLVKTPGEKATEIVQVVTGLGTATTNTNAVTAIQKNADGGIYQFTIDSTTATTATVTYKYSKREAAPMVEKETTGTYAGSSTSPLTINDDNFNDGAKAFEKDIISITDKNGIQLNRGTDYDYNDKVTINKTGYYQGDAFTVRYTYRDISMISEKPLTGDVTVTDAAGGVGGNATVTIQLTDIAAYAGRSYYLKAVITDTQAGSGAQPTTETIYYNKIVPSTGIITINAPTTWTEITSGTYEIWVY